MKVEDDDYIFWCPDDIQLSSAIMEKIKRLQESGKLAGGVKVEAVPDAKTYAYNINSGRAEVVVTGTEAGRLFMRWDGATRDEDERYPYPPKIKGLDP